MAELLCHLLREMVVEIVSWVPADSLLELKCLSKLWLALITELIDDPEFVAVHLSNTKKRPSTTIVVDSEKCQTDCGEVRLSSITFQKNGKTHPVSEELDLPPRLALAGGSHGLLVFHCDGIVCLAQDPNTVLICNPILHEYRIVPKLETDDYEAMGFAYDSKTNDYKLIRVSVEERVRAEVYSVNNDSWKVITMLDDTDIQDFLSNTAFYWRGVCSWNVIDVENRSAILCFDMREEEFYVISNPVVEKIDEFADFCVWNDSLAWYRCYDKYRKDDEYVLEIYVLDGNTEKNKAASWRKALSAGPFLYIVRILAFIDNDQVLLRDNNDDLYTCNVYTKKIRKVRIRDEDNQWMDCHCSYERSLVSVKRRRKL